MAEGEPIGAFGTVINWLLSIIGVLILAITGVIWRRMDRHDDKLVKIAEQYMTKTDIELLIDEIRSQTIGSHKDLATMIGSMEERSNVSRAHIHERINEISIKLSSIDTEVKMLMEERMRNIANETFNARISSAIETAVATRTLRVRDRRVGKVVRKRK